MEEKAPQKEDKDKKMENIKEVNTCKYCFCEIPDGYYICKSCYCMFGGD